MEVVVLNNGYKIPKVGLGVFLTKDSETVDMVKWALKAGYRHIDTAKLYDNEEAVAKGIKESGVDRSDIHITTKIAPADVMNQETAKGFEESLAKLDTDYVDLMLLHWPMTDELNLKAWKVLEDYYKVGKAKAIGVSNYTNRQLQVLLDNCEIKPVVNQIEVDPLNNRTDQYDFCMKNDIYLEAYCPLGGTGNTAAVLGNPVITEIAKEINRSPAQVIIRWNVQRDVIVIPKSVHEERIKENYQVFDFELSAEQMKRINAISDPNAQKSKIDAEKAYEFFSNMI